MTTYIYNKNELYHYGILGQKWGVRRYQNEDGSLTPAGKKRYEELDRQASKYDKQAASKYESAKKYKAVIEDLKKNGKNSKYYDEYQDGENRESVRNAINQAKIFYKEDKQYADEAVKIAENIRNTAMGSKSIEEKAKFGEYVSTGVAIAVVAGGVKLSKTMANKGVIGKGASVVTLVNTLPVASLAAGLVTANTDTHSQIRNAKTNTTVNTAANKKIDDRIAKHSYNYSKNNI